MKKMIIATAVLSCFACAPAFSGDMNVEATGLKAISAGSGAKAEATQADSTAVAIGAGSKATVTATNGYAVALAGGTAEDSAGRAGGSIAIGNGARAVNDVADSGLSLAIGGGASSKATGTTSIAVGWNAQAGQSQIVIGYQRASEHSSSTDKDDGPHVAQAMDNSTTVGVNTYTGGAYDVVVGQMAEGTGEYATSVGDAASSAQNAVAVGYAARARAKGSISLGSGSSVVDGASWGVAIGDGAHVFSGSEAMALGDDSQAYADKSLALGSGSIAREKDTVSVGRTKEDGRAFTRRIVNVSAGTADSDAVVVSQLKASESKLEEEIKSDGKVLSDKVQGLSDGLEKTEASLSKVSGKMTSLGDDVQSLKDGLGKTDGRVADLEKADQANKQGLVEFKKQVEAFSSADGERVERLSGRQAAFEGRLDSFDRRLDDQNKEIRRGLATQAALSGLFQPYSVGRFNVTASFGGYKSEQALAVGAGYRATQQFAVKAGLATNLKSGGTPAYNVAVDYEF